jgi:predicted Zn-dependent peptidase
MVLNFAFLIYNLFRISYLLFRIFLPLDSVLSQTSHSHTFPNGLTLVAERMDWVESAAFTLLVPAGCQHDPAGRLGLASLTSEMVQRGCGERDSRQFLEDLERLGADTSSSVSTAHSSFGGAVLAEKLPEVLSLHADLILRPHLPADQITEARLVCLQDLKALDDDFAGQSMVELRRRHYADPYGRSHMGREETFSITSIDEVKAYFADCYRPGGAILGVAGNIDWRQLRDQVGEMFSAWQQGSPPEITERPPDRQGHHVEQVSSQTHIAVAYDSVPYSHDNYLLARGAVGVLSDGMSSRLFTEIRERRGLVYTVYASSSSLKDRGAVMAYAGTTTDRAQETLDVLLAELRRISQGIDDAELARLKTRIKSALIMQQESSRSRSSSLALDWYHLGRIRPLEELSGLIEGLTTSGVNAYLAEHPPADFTIVTVGEKPLEVSSA